ncbi:MAG: ATP-binding cassette domain-containing protein [Azospirillaceae bacterium]
MTGALLDIRDLKKSFGPIEVLKGVSFEVAEGEVVALVGDNGAGKSTLMKIVTGVHLPDAGTVTFAGRPLPFGDPRRTRELGIEMIYQDLALAREQDVAANIFLGREPLRRMLGFLPIRVLDSHRMHDEAERIIAHLGARLPSTDYRVGSLSGGQQQSVAIARAITFQPKLVIMDEPTAALAVREVEHVLDLIRELKSRGIGVILISHRLPDVFAVADRMIALRQGVVAADVPAAETTMAEIVSHIVGAA